MSNFWDYSGRYASFALNSESKLFLPTAFFVFTVIGSVYLVLSHKITRARWSRTYPVLEYPVNPMSLVANLPPYSKWFPGIEYTWGERLTRYKDSEIVAVHGSLFGGTSLWTSSPDIIRQVLGTKAPFSKPPRAMLSLEIMGTNVVASNGDTWKLHRKIASPAFSHEGYRQVWAETMRTFSEMSACEGWDNRDVVEVADPTVFTRKLALFIIASCGFNIPLSWEDGDLDERGQMSLRAVLSNVASSIFVRWLTPKLFYYLPIQDLQRVDTAYTRLESFLNAQIRNRKEEIQFQLETDPDSVDAKRDLFSRLVASSFREGKMGLTDQEIIGNIFIAMFAGHETTAHSLVLTLTLLGLYEDEQALIYKRIVDVIGDRTPAFEDYEALEPVILPAVYEAMRLYPAVYLMLRQADRDATISVPKTDGSGNTEVPVPKGTEIVLDLVGVGYNPRMYPDTNSFKPMRFDGMQAHDTSMAFSYGPRVCLGKKFATTEMVCFLTLMLQKWEVRVARGAGETREQWRERNFRPMLNMTMQMPPLPIQLVRRQT